MVLAEKQQYGREGTDITLTCKGNHVLKQDTKVTTSWTFKVQKIPFHNDSRYKASTYRDSNSISLELVVRNASLSDSGDYACNVANREGSAMATTKLHVQSKGETSFPISDKTAGDSTVQVKLSFTQIEMDGINQGLKCSAMILACNIESPRSRFRGRNIPRWGGTQGLATTKSAARGSTTMMLTARILFLSSSSSSSSSCALEDLRPDVEIEKGKGEGEDVVEVPPGSRVKLLCRVSYPLHMKPAQSYWRYAREVKNPIVSYEESPGRKGFENVELSLEIVNVSSQRVGLYVCALNSSEGLYITDHVQLQLARGANGFTLLDDAQSIVPFFFPQRTFDFLCTHTSHFGVPEGPVHSQE